MIFLFISSFFHFAIKQTKMAPHFLSFVSLYSAYLRRCFAGAGLSSQTIEVDNETTVHFWGPKPDQTPRKPSLLLIHGFGPPALWQWRRQVQFFSRQFNVYVPDLIFFGGSVSKSSERSEIFQAVSVGKLLEKLGVKKFHVLGTSYGGIVAYQMAKMWPDRAEKVVIASSGVNLRPTDTEALLKRAELESVENLMLPESAAHMRKLCSLAIHRPPSMVPDFLFNDFVEKLYKENRKEKMELLKGLTVGKDDTPIISPLKQDVLIIWGEHDQIFPCAMASELKGLIGEKVRLEAIKDASHVPQIEQTRKFNVAVQSFLCDVS